jgi:uncharacterized protein (TIGR03643 family)
MQGSKKNRMHYPFLFANTGDWSNLIKFAKSHMPRNHRTSEQISQIIRLAWEDRTSFEDIEKRTGLAENQVIEIMRAELKPSSYRMWRKRVSGRVTKHRKLMESRFKGPDSETF